MGKLNKGMMTSNKQTWTTPKDLFQQLDSIWNFDCDLFASEENALCDKYFTEENSAFDNKWGKVNFANPPFTTKIQNKAFLKAHINAYLSNKTTIMLVPARTDTKRFHDIVFANGYKVIFIKGRLKFGGSKNPAPFPSCYIIFKGGNRC